MSKSRRTFVDDYPEATRLLMQAGFIAGAEAKVREIAAQLAVLQMVLSRR